MYQAKSGRYEISAELLSGHRELPAKNRIEYNRQRFDVGIAAPLVATSEALHGASSAQQR
jgi:hypothetical protein